MSARAAASSSHVVVRRLHAGRPDRVHPAGYVDHLRHPVAADERRVEPLEGKHPRAPPLPCGRSDRIQPRLEPVLKGRREHRLSGRNGHASDVRDEDLVQRLGVEREHLGPARQALGDGADVVVGDGADGAQGLRDDQVGLELCQLGLVERVERLATRSHLPHLGVDLGGRRGPPGSRWRSAGAAARLRGPVAFVRDGDDAVAQAEGEQDLGGRGHQARDSHGIRIGSRACSITLA